MMLWLTVPSVVALAITALNAATWRQRPAHPGANARVSVLIPARNEARSIESCVRSIAANQPHEIWVLDDGSTDATPDILARLTREIPALKVLSGKPLPSDWVGKPHACHQLAAAATGDVLVFVDADVTLEPTGLQQLLGWLTEGTQVVTVLPRQRMETLPEKALMPLLHLTYTAWLPLQLISWTHDPRILAANGQVLALPRWAYDQIGGFEAVRGEVVDDMAFCRMAKRGNLRVRFVHGLYLASCRMYQSFDEIWAGFSKNLYAGIGANPLALLIVVGLYLATLLLPLVALAAAVFDPALLLPGVVGTGCVVLLRLINAWRFREPGWATSLLLHPFAVLVFCAIALNSARWYLKGAVQWAGRTYRPAKEGLHG